MRTILFPGVPDVLKPYRALSAAVFPGHAALRRLPRQLTPLAWAAACLCVAPPVLAQTRAALPEVRVQSERDGTSEGTGAYTASKVEGATGLGLSLRETPQSVSVITRQRLDDQ